MRDGFASNFRIRFVRGGVPEAVSAFTFWELHSSPELIFSGCEVSFEELFELRFSSSNSPTSSSLWPSSSSSLSSSSLNSSLSVSFLLFHWSNGKTFDHTKLWWELIQTLRHNTFRRDIVAEICSLWARISWASWCCKGEYFLMEWEAQWLLIGSGTSGFGFDFGRILEINWDFLCRSSSRTVTEKENQRPSNLCETSCV